MGDWVRLNTCGSCANFDFEGENKKGYCRRFGAYYWPDDSCRYYEEGSSTSSGGCYLTSACCQYKGLPDDCYELQTLRQFRDNELISLPDGQAIIERYYRDAPKIVSRIEASEQKDAIYGSVYEKIKEIVAYIEKGEHIIAILQYMLLTYDLAHFIYNSEETVGGETI